MPVILKPEDEDKWLMETDQTLLNKLLVPYAAGRMETYTISKKLIHQK